MTDIQRLSTKLQDALGSDFQVQELLGEGGYAAVFRARDVARRRDVAIKALDLGVTPSAELAERFVREARTVAQLDHPNIVAVYKVGGYQNSLLYIVMRCVNGPSLRSMLERRRRLSVTDAVRVARLVAQALDYAHARHVVHRDIKPDNILLDEAGHVLVTDFGIAKAGAGGPASQLTSEGMVVGTPHYMSPEQATGERVDARSDIYSLGIVLYQMLTGSPPFDGESAQAILMKQATGTPVPVRDIRGDVPRSVATVLDRMLEKDPKDRYQNAQALCDALLEARPEAAGDRIGLRRRKSDTPQVARIAAAGAGLILVATAALLSAAVFGRAPRVRVSAPVSDSLKVNLQQRGILARTDTAVFAFSPNGQPEPPLLVVARHRVAIAEPRRLRGYPRSEVSTRWGTRWQGGPRIVFILLAGGRPDTVFTRLSPRDAWELARGVKNLLPPAN